MFSFSEIMAVWDSANYVSRVVHYSHTLVTDEIPDFYFYSYDGHHAIYDSLYDDMFDDGNIVSFKTSGGIESSSTNYHRTGSHPADYGRVYSYEDNFVFATTAHTHPFIAYMWIDNKDATTESYEITVESESGQDGDGTHTQSSGSVTLGGYEYDWKIVQLFGGGDPSQAELFFTIKNPTEWGSSDFTFEIVAEYDNYDELENKVTVTGHPENIALVYMLLSTFDEDDENGREITDEEVGRVITAFHTSVGQDELLTQSHVAGMSVVDQVFHHLMDPMLGITSTIENTAVTNFYGIIFDELTYYGDDYHGLDDGGYYQDLYDYGNYVDIPTDQDDRERIKYATKYSYPHHEFYSTMSGPFHAVMYIEDGSLYAGSLEKFYIRVYGESDHDGYGEFSTITDGLITSNGYTMHYSVKQIHGTNEPNICELYYTVSNNLLWGSTADVVLTSEFDISDTDDLEARVSVPVTTKNTFLGYILLSQFNFQDDESKEIPQGEIEAVLLAILQAYEAITL
jgi:hypothetical protein